MSVSVVTKELEKFLLDDRCMILAVRGAWGVGKTYLWEQDILQRKEIKKYLKNYSYVSLFGPETIKDIKFSIWTNKIDLSADTEKNSDSVTSRIKKGLKKYSEHLPNSYKGFGFPLKDVVFDSIENTVICFDDLERAGKGISIEDIFGIASFLKEKRKCKIVFLLNEDMLGNKKDTFDSYSEKVIDISIKLEPIVEESFGLVFDEADQEKFSNLKTICTSLNITNIRILLKLKHFLDLFFNLSKHHDIHEKTKHELVFLISLLVYCHFERSNPKLVPSLSEIKSDFPLYCYKSADEIPENVSRKLEFLEKNGFREDQSNHWELVTTIIDSIQVGYVREEHEYINCLLEREDSITGDLAVKNFENTWKELYLSDFGVQPEVFVNGIELAFRNAVENLGINQLDLVVWAIKKLGQEKRAENLVDFFLEQNSSKYIGFLLSDWPFPIRDKYLLKKLEDLSTQKIQLNLNVFIRDSLSISRALQKEEVEFLSQFTSVDFLEAIKGIKNDLELANKIIKMLKELPSEHIQGFPYNAFKELSSALRVLGEENIVNQFRVDEIFKESRLFNDFLNSKI